MLSFPVRSASRAVGTASAALNASSSSSASTNRNECAPPPNYISAPGYSSPPASSPTPALPRRLPSTRLPPPPVPPPASAPMLGPQHTPGKPVPTVWRVVNASCKKLHALGYGHDERGMAKRLLCRQMLENVQQMSREHQQRRRDRAIAAGQDRQSSDDAASAAITASDASLGADASSLTRRTSTGSCDHLMATQTPPKGPHLGVSLHGTATGDTDTEPGMGHPNPAGLPALPPRQRTTLRGLFRRKSPSQPPTIMFNSSA